LSEVVRSAVEHSKSKQEWRARQQHGSGTGIKRHWDSLPASVRADVKDLAQWRDYYGRFTPFAELCQKNGTDLYTALRQYNWFENLCIQDPTEGIVAICQRLGIDPRIQAQALWQRVYDPQGWAAQKVNNSSYQTGASHMAGAARVADANSFLEANPGARHLINEMSEVLSRSTFPPGASNWQKLEWSYAQALKDARAKAATVNKAKKAGKAVGGAPSYSSRGGSGSGNSTRDAILEAINAQRGTA
jgi:hypothetical protein